MIRHALCALLALVLCAAAPGQPKANAPNATTAGQPLPSDPRPVTGEFENGLAYIVRRHAVPPGRAAVWLHVSTGSLNETERQRGLAHFLEHMAFNGSANFPPGKVIPFFQSLGLTFGQHQNAFTGFDQTAYQLALPDNTPETLDKGLLFLSDVAFRLTLPPEEINRERAIILEEKRASAGGRQRVQEEILKRLAPGSLVGERIPIGVVETITAVAQADFRDYYTRWYRPSNMTVLAVADMDEKVMVEHLARHFGKDGVRTPTPVDQDAQVTAARENRGVVATDEELARAEISMIRVTPARPPSTTVEHYRRDTVEYLGERAFGRRMARLVSAGAVSFQRAGASASDEFRAIHIADVKASGEPSKWRQMLTDAATELRRATLHGFSAREIADARKELVSMAERGVETEPTLPADALLGSMNDSIASGEPIMSAAQNLEILQKVLPTITDAEVSRAFREAFDTAPPGLLFVLEAPTNAGAPTEEEFVALATEALKASPEAAAEMARAESLMGALPTPGEVAESSEHEASGVWSGWLSNGVRVHHRFMDYRKDQVTVTITLAAGNIQETAENRGIADAAAIAWQRAATSTLSSNDIRDLMTGVKASVIGTPGMDTMRLVASGSPQDVEIGMQLAHLLLTDPVIEKSAFDLWKEQQKQIIAIRALQVEFVFIDLFNDTIFPAGDARHRALTREQLDRLTREGAQQWLTSTIGSAPIEVSIVGDLSHDHGVALATRYLGSLSPRERISAETLAELRRLERPAGPLSARRELKTQTDKAFAVSGFFGAEQHAVRDQQLLEIASRVMTNRMIMDLRESKGLVYSIGANSSPAQEFPGFGMFFAFSSTDPAKVDSLLGAIRGMYGAFAETGPSEDEMQTVRKQIATALSESMLEPEFWTGVLASLTYRARNLDDVVEAPEAYQEYPADHVRDAFASYYKPAASFEVSAMPQGGEAPADGADAPPAPPAGNRKPLP